MGTAADGAAAVAAIQGSRPDIVFLDVQMPRMSGLDVVQATVRDGVATPRFGSSALLGPIVHADGFFRVPEAATGLGAGSEVDVELYC